MSAPVCSLCGGRWAPGPSVSCLRNDLCEMCEKIWLEGKVGARFSGVRYLRSLSLGSLKGPMLSPRQITDDYRAYRAGLRARLEAKP